MFHPGDYVVYAGNGLCLVENVGMPDFQTAMNASRYYFLRTADDKSRIYVPVDTSMPIRSPITSQEAEELLAELPAMKTDIPPKRDYKTMLQLCKNLLRPQTARAMAQTIKMLHTAHPSGKMSSEEERIYKQTQSRLNEELAYALHISANEAGSRLRNALN